MSRGFEIAEPPRNERLYTLLRRVRSGDILIPRFQRGFLWTDDQRLVLLDSIYRRMPVGTIILWATVNNDLACYQRIAGVSIEVDPKKKAGHAKKYLLDGLQRLSTLYAAFGDGLETQGTELWGRLSDAELEELPGDDRPSALVFDLGEQVFRLAPRTRPMQDTWFPLARLFDRFALREYEDRCLRSRADGRQLLHRLDALVEAIKDYELPVVTLATEDVSVATEAFARVNSQGTPIDHVNMLGATVWSDGLDLMRCIDEDVRPELAEVGWQELEDKMILNTAKALLGLDIYRTEVAAVGSALSRYRNQIFARTASALVRAAKLLAQWGIYKPSVLPYSYQIVLIANALDQAGSKPSADGIRKWFWGTTYAETFAGMNSSRLMRTMDHVVDIARGMANPLDLLQLGLEGPVRPITRFDFRSARSRALAVMMAEHMAYRENGAPSSSDRRLPAEYGNDAVHMLYTGSDLTSALRRTPGNRFLANPRNAKRLRRRVLQDVDNLTKSECLGSFLPDFSSLSPLQRIPFTLPSEMIRFRTARIIELESAKVRALGLAYDETSL